MIQLSVTDTHMHTWVKDQESLTWESNKDAERHFPNA